MVTRTQARIASVPLIHPTPPKPETLGGFPQLLLHLLPIVQRATELDKEHVLERPRPARRRIDTGQVQAVPLEHVQHVTQRPWAPVRHGEGHQAFEWLYLGVLDGCREAVGAGSGRLAGDDQEPSCVIVSVLDVARQDGEVVRRCRQRRGDGCAGPCLILRGELCGFGRAACFQRLDSFQILGEESLRLAKGLRVGVDAFDMGERG